MSNPCVAIVDPYSSGAMLAEALRAQGAKCVAVQSSPCLPTSMRSRFEPHDFVEVIEHDTDFARTLRSVARHAPSYVIAGFESGVELAERLGEALSLPVNDARLREARRDKFLMTEAVRAAGLRTARQFQSQNVAEIIGWIQDTLDWPVVVKPIKSVASDHVRCCRSGEEVREAAESILSEANILGARNQAVLVQEYLAGTEYAVDVVSCQGHKKTTAIWQYGRPPGACDDVGYDAMTLLPYSGPRQEVLTAYAHKLLDALAIRFGPAHCEVMWVNDEPIVVEVGARLSAGSNAVLSRTCGGICQLDETVEAILAPERFLATLHEQPCLQQYAANVFLSPPRPGRLARLQGIDEIHRLPTLHSMSIGAKPGDMLGRVAGMVTLIAADMDAIERDIDELRRLQEDGLFELEDDLPA